MGKTSTNKGLSVATFDYRMVYYSSWVSSLNSITSVFVGVFWYSCLKTLSLAPSLPLQALLLLLELVHLCPLRAEFRIAVALSIWSIIQYIQHHPELPQEHIPLVRGGCHNCFLIPAKSRGSAAREPPARLQLPRKSGPLYHVLPAIHWQDLLQIASDSFRFCLRMLTLLTFCRAKYVHIILHVCFAIQPHCSEQLDARHRKRKLRPCQFDETLLDSRPSKRSKFATFRERSADCTQPRLVHCSREKDQWWMQWMHDFHKRSCLGELGEVQGKIPPDARQCHAAGQGPELVLIGQ